MRKVVLRRTYFSPIAPYPSYSMELTVTAAEDITAAIFVKQRFGDDASSDVFAAIATPEQLETLPDTAPELTTSYFRSDTIQITALNHATLVAIYASILEEVQLLIANLNSLDTAETPATTVEITETAVTVM